MDLSSSILLFSSGVLGGALNSVAGGGSFLVFPALLASGVSPVVANATTTVGLWPAALSSAWAYRRELPRGQILWAGSLASVVGGAIGAYLLVASSETTFVRLLPWLMLLASMVFTLGPRASRRDGQPRLSLAAVLGIQFVIAIYGGYFGGGMGILMLATYALMGMRDIHAMNALKTILGALLNGIAVVVFLKTGKVVMSEALPVLAGAITGGWGGASIARKLPGSKVRIFVLGVAWSMTAYFFYRSLR